MLFTLRPERPTTQLSSIRKSSFTQPINEVDFIIHETDTTTKPFPSIREVVTPSRKSTTTPQSTTRQTTTTSQPLTRKTITVPQPTRRTTTTTQPTTRKTTTMPQPTTKSSTTMPQPTTRTITAPQPTTRKPEYLDYVDVEFRVPDPS